MTLALALLGLSTGVADAAPLKIGVIRGTSDNTGDQLAAQLNDSSVYDYEATEVSINDVNSVDDLSQFSVLVLSDNGSRDGQDVVFGKAAIFSEYFNAGGGIVGTSWILYWRVSTEVDFLVVDSTFTGTQFCSGAQTISIDSSHPITAGISDFTSTANHWETPAPSYPDVEILGTCTGKPAVSYRESDGARGRTVYVGGLYGARTSYNNGGLRSGVQDQLLEQAVAWASQSCLDEDGDGSLSCGGDCDDSDDKRFPGSEELCDGIDNDCDDEVPADEIDGDGDTQPLCAGDCDDTDKLVYNGAPELCDGRDTDCFGGLGSEEVDVDSDGQLLCAGDCDDDDPARFTGNTEICDGLDNDCADGVPADEADTDGDTQRACEGDCDDDDPARFTGNTEICDGVDNDCADGVPADESDADADGYKVCESDCDDADNGNYPGNSEVCDGADNDCDGTADNGLETTDYWLDEDGDGYGVGEDDAPTTSSCQELVGYSTFGGDCDDLDELVNPEAEEVPGNEIDEDCDGEFGDDPQDTGLDTGIGTDDSERCGCSSSTPMGGFAWLMAPLLIGLRRRR